MIRGRQGIWHCDCGLKAFACNEFHSRNYIAKLQIACLLFSGSATLRTLTYLRAPTLQGKRSVAAGAGFTPGAASTAATPAADTPAAASRPRRRPPAARTSPDSAAKVAAAAKSAAKFADKKRPANLPEPYVMPDDFDAEAALVACDFSDAAAVRRTLPWAFLQRWLALRDEVQIHFGTVLI